MLDLALFDSRTADRYRGENETIDPVAGHIPGARFQIPYPDNLQADGCSQSAPALRALRRCCTAPAREAIFYCGSGVTAAHNVLAVTHEFTMIRALRRIVERVDHRSQLTGRHRTESLSAA